MKLSHQLPVLATSLLLVGCSGYDQTSDSNRSDMPVAARGAQDTSKTVAAQPPPAPPAPPPAPAAAPVPPPPPPILATNAPTDQVDTNANPAPKPPSASSDDKK